MSSERFTEVFGATIDQAFFSPGRVNLIGEHIDYCGGLVFPMAIDKGTYGWARRSAEPHIEIFSERFNEKRDVPLKPGKPTGHWSDFVVGVVSLLSQELELNGMQLYVSDDVGAGGLSSSASFSLLLAHSLLWAAGKNITTDEDRLALAKLCQQVEHEFIGVNCGIMDQASVALGGSILLDCKTLQFERAKPISATYELIVMDTRHARDLAGSKYNERVAEIAQIKSQIAGLTQVDELCDIQSKQLPALFARLNSEALTMRLRHVVSENERVTAAKAALDQNDVAAFGQLMNASHDSLGEDYEVTGPALDLMVDLSRKQAGCIGARMTGAGFGGCALALVEAARVTEHNAQVTAAFKRQTGVQPVLFSVKAGNAAGPI